jgi:ribosomal protein S27AE
MQMIRTLVARVKARYAALRAGMEAESRTWMIQCPRCGYERSVWDSGGIMYKAYGTSWKFRKCPRCGKSSWHKVYRRKAPPAAERPTA